MALPKISLGDVFEINTKNGCAYFQCVKESPKEECELIRILHGTYSDVNDADIEKLVNTKELFFIQFPLKYAVKKKCVRKVGNYPLPSDIIIPRYFREQHNIRGEFLGWHIIDSLTLKRELVSELSDEQVKLSPYGIWNDTLIAERIVDNWSLEQWR